jgi:uncharacterized protein involved in type VI secretion and phage assembly
MEAAMFENQELIGLVSENDDPDGLHRIRVYFPHMEGSQVTGWIPYQSGMTGNETGISMLPEIDAPVLVTALDSAWTQMVAHPGPYTETHAPPETEENSDADRNQDGKNSLHFIKSRSGHLVIMDDSEGKEKFQVVSPDKKTRIEMDSEAELIKFETDKDYMTETKGTAAITAETITVSAEKEFTADSESIQMTASDVMELTGDKDISVKGSGVSLN